MEGAQARAFLLASERSEVEMQGSTGRRFGIAALLLLFTLSYSWLASAAGSVQWKDTRPKERDNGSWNLELTITLPKPPDIAHVPVKFEFTQKVYYERTLVDGKDGPQLRKVPMPNKQAQIESVTIGFLDPGTGTIQNRTRFTFRITRGHGFEAGEYSVLLRNATNGQAIGRAVTLTLDGENKVVDRRAISFVDSKEKKDPDKQMKGVDKDGNIKDDKDKAPAIDEDADVADPGVGKDGWDPIYGAPIEDDGSEGSSADNPQTLKEKPGGCGCSVPAGPSHGAGALLLALGLVALGWRRWAAP